MKRNLQFKPKQAQGGFTLVELLVGITITLAMASTLIFSFSGDRTKAALISESARQYGDAFLRYKTDTGVTPIQVQSLLLKAKNLAADTVEGIAATTTWRGPYVNGFKVDTTTGGASIDAISAGVVMRLGQVAAAQLPTGLTVGTEFIFTNIPDTVVAEYVANCNGTDPAAVLPTNYSAGNKCWGTKASGGTAGTVRNLIISK